MQFIVVDLFVMQSQSGALSKCKQFITMSFGCEQTAVNWNVFIGFRENKKLFGKCIFSSVSPAYVIHGMTH